MNVQLKTSNGVYLVPMETRLLDDRKIFLDGEINRQTACEFTKKIMILSEQDNESPIDVMINSEGGEIQSGMLIYDVLQSEKIPIRTFCLGTAYSMAALLFASGRHGRYIFKHSALMLHEPMIMNRVGGSASSIRSISESLMDTREKINQILSKHTGKTSEEIEKVTGYDHYFTPEESVEFGLADGIITFDDILEGKF